MQPNEPEISPVDPKEDMTSVVPVVDVATEETATVPSEREPFWGYMDLALMMGLMAASALLILLVVGMFVATNAKLREDPTPLAVPIQFLLYGLIYLSFWLVLGLRYHRPLLLSLGWKRSTFNLFAVGLGGAALAFAISGLASLLHTPKVPSPVDKLVDTPLSFAMVAVLAMVAAPFFEELFFRGFLQPLFSRTFGVVAGILITAILFGSLHAPEYSWAWQYVVAISLAGAVFGWVRARAKSIIPSIVMHGCFNAMSVIALAVTKYSNYKLDI
jgi:membrane protease YdiL (CAAX protease family)